MVNVLVASSDFLKLVSAVGDLKVNFRITCLQLLGDLYKVVTVIDISS